VNKYVSSCWKKCTLTRERVEVAYTARRHRWVHVTLIFENQLCYLRCFIHRLFHSTSVCSNKLTYLFTEKDNLSFLRRLVYCIFYRIVFDA